ncbi:DUF2190 family protein [Clostridioides difficile]|uniref:DUF2190 family protein n=1 Tax=Clostridioides TaxID=1870884 RepID=UPI00038C91F3|nr:DUF2190 family protein [Clostridioides difficile]EQG78771.1 hypothetical protein QKA_0342 [Clostridioides difficile DA00165]MCC0744871.1 DUF2190 family protein [Clostridioides sp. ZZV14-6044]MCC0752024.1 DUF2190 family protein [Clostridioides sp. ZZV13-5731]EAA0008360.1 DUF2190 family protein [Clostridioides difficile]EGT3777066.1 DUF2190 family protein [Clostridioides difficile]
MAFKGQPTPSTITQITRAKISDGKSVRVILSDGESTKTQQFYLINGFFGVAMQDGEKGDEVTLQIEQAEYETDNIVTSEAFEAGELIYWDNTAKKFTTTSTSNRLVGRVTDGKDSNNVIWFILLPQQ